MKFKVVITGASGMVGEGVLHECIQHQDIELVLVVGRRPCGIQHPKMKEILVDDFFKLESIESQLSGYDACFFCLGVSSIGLGEAEYYKFTYELTMNFAKTLLKYNPAMCFCYISGKATDSSEKGKMMWARIKGKTENDLMKLPFKSVYHFRPGMLTPTKGLQNTLSLYKYFGWLAPLLRLLAPDSITSLKQLGLAMINVVRMGYAKSIIEVRDIRYLSK